MEEILTELFELNILSFFVSVFVILSACIAIYEIIGKFSVIIGRPVKWVTNKNKDHELLLDTVKEVNYIKKQQKNNVEMFTNHEIELVEKVDELTNMFIDKQIDDMRYEILDFASAVSLGRDYTKEQYMHTIEITDKYHQIIEARGLKNGQAEISTQIIKDSFEEKMKNGSFK